ncbi:prostatic acid phosphatase-like isoform X2 [Euwallacea fornicatus]|uniref:prostatic acid phosphatase-like isoform X2 n=1 Tax=Euwallacea fornicatus TaxID=995702 RepID=UPI00338ECCC5
MASRERIKRQLSKHIHIVLLGLGTFTVLIIIGIVVGISLKDNKRQLQMVHIIMRHGARTPADTFPTDPHVNDTLYPIGWGQLTNEGKLQQFETGKFLRKRYNKFLGDVYSPDEYYTQSTDVDRTRTSMQVVNAGLWPPKAAQKWGPLKWQPIPVHMEPLSQDMLLLVRKPCAAYHRERDRVVKSEEMQSRFKQYQDLFKGLTKYTGRVVKDFGDVEDVFSTLKAEEGYNFTLPEWTKQFYPEKMLEPTVFSYILNSWNDKMNRLKGGLFLKKIISDWYSKVNGITTQKASKAFLYGGHDSTIVNLMRTMKIWDTQFPDYGITILLEFSKDSRGEYGVEVFLRNSTFVEPYQLTIPGCKSVCPLRQFVDLTKSVIPGNWEEECENNGDYEVPEPDGP